MVREIVHCQVGQCGNQIGNAFWNTVRKEHSLEKDGKFIKSGDNRGDSDKLSKIDVYFKETGELRYGYIYFFVYIGFFIYYINIDLRHGHV